MGSGVSDLSHKGLEEVISKVRDIPSDSRLNGEEVESIIGLNLFDPNDYDAIATYDEKTDLHTVKQEDLLKLLIAQQVDIDPDAAAATINEYEEQEEARRFRSEILSRKRPAGNVAEMRGAVWPQESIPSATYLPILPETADSRTKHYPYAGATILIVQQRPEGGGWNIGLFRNSKTGEWGTISATFGERHAISQSKANALRACAAESLYEQSCGLLHCSPRHIEKVLRDDCSVSVPFDDGKDMDSDGKLRALMQIFLIRVEGLTPHNFTHNREVVIQNLKSQQSKKPWLEMDDFTFVNAQTFSDPLKLGNSIADINGQICTCRRLVNLFGRKVVSFDDVVINSRVLPELILKFETLLYNIETKILDLKHEKELKFSYFEKRWFGKEKPKDHHHQNDEKSLVIHDGKKNKNEEEDDDDDIEKENNDDKGEEDSVTEVVELLRHPELNGGVLAGAFTASLISVDSLLIRKSS